MEFDTTCILERKGLTYIEIYVHIKEMSHLVFSVRENRTRAVSCTHVAGFDMHGFSTYMEAVPILIS